MRSRYDTSSPGRERSTSTRRRGRLQGPALCVCGVLAALVLSAAVPAGAAAVTRYVDQNHADCMDSGAGAGTATRPYCTIGAAAAKSTGGTTVRVSQGTYGEEVAPRSGSTDNPVVFRADPGETVTVTGDDYGFYVSGKLWVTIEGFNVTNTISDGIHVSSASKNVKLIGNTVSYAGKPELGLTAKGISVTDSTNSVVQDNVVHHNSTYGIYLSNSTGNQVVGNTSSFNAKVFSRGASGIRLHTANNNTVSSNVTHDNEDSGIELVTGSRDNLIVNNLAYGNGDHGIDNLDAPGQRIVGNSIYDNVTAGINAEGDSPNTTMANNIAVDNGISSPRTTGNIRVDSTSIAGTTIDYDLVHLRTTSAQFVWGTTQFSSRADFAAATGQESHGLQADPLWIAPGSGDFHLTHGSPAIDSANSGAAGAAATDLEGTARIDDLSKANTGAGPRLFDDRGAYEYPAVEGPPSASVAVTPNAGTAPLPVTADASGSTDFDGSPISTYRFDFGDGTVVGPQAGATASHTYKSGGTFTVTVTVTDTEGRASTATTQVDVNPPPEVPPSPVLTVSPGSGKAPLAVTADGSGSTDDSDSSPIASYHFDFGDGTIVGFQAGATAVHTYTAAGTYTVTLTVTDTGGRSATATTQVAVSENDAPPSASLTLTPGSGTAPLPVTADGSGSTPGATPIESYRFDFGDGTIAGPQPAATADHTYRAAGTYTVTLTVTDTAGRSSTATTQITVNQPELPPSAVLTVNPGSGYAPVSVTADASGSSDDLDSTPISTYRFDFGDGTVVGPQAAATAEHTYTRGGRYTVTVTVTDSGGQSSTATAEVIVYADFVTNGGFETDLTGWNTSGSDPGMVLDRVAGGHSGASAARATNTTVANGSCTLNDAPNFVTKTTSGGSYTAAMWVRADADGATLRLRIREYDGTALVQTATQYVGLTTSWQQVSVVLHAPAAAGTSTLDLNASVVGAAPGTCFYADDVSLQFGPEIPPPPPDPNLVGNPGFELNLTGWSTGGSGAGVSLSRVTGGHSGSWSAKVANTSTAASTCVLNDAPNVVTTTSAGTYTASMWVRSDRVGERLKLRFREYSGTSLMGSQLTELPLTTAWQKVTLAYVPAAPGASTLDLNALVTGAAPGTCFYADDVSIERG
jgi:parallel beta-helix repeat protein